LLAAWRRGWHKKVRVRQRQNILNHEGHGGGGLVSVNVCMQIRASAEKAHDIFGHLLRIAHHQVTTWLWSMSALETLAWLWTCGPSYQGLVNQTAFDALFLD
jgi:hypothetical protein